MRTSALLLAAAALCAAPAPARASTMSPAAESHLDEGLKHLYALDYSASRAAFQKIIDEEPDSPWGYLFAAGGIWWQASQEYGLFKSTPALQGVFESDVESALKKSESWIDSKDPEKRPAGYFVSGMAHGTRGQWKLMRGRYLDAYFDGKKAVKHLKKCVKLDPGFEDAWLGLGVFDYQSAHLSGVAKLGILFGVRGNEKRGLEEIRRAAEKARFARRQSAQFLSSVYLIDLRDDAKALPLIEGLRKDYPDSAYFLFLEALLRHRLGDFDASVALARQVHAGAAADPAGFRRKRLTLACGLSGADCLPKPALEGVLAWADRAIAALPPPAPPPAPAKKRRKGRKAPPAAPPAPPDTFPTHLQLLRGEALDALGRREEAKAAYERALALPPFDESREIARACLAAPCTREVLLERLRSQAREP